VKPGVNLWSRVLIYNRLTREREREREIRIPFLTKLSARKRMSRISFSIRVPSVLAHALSTFPLSEDDARLLRRTVDSADDEGGL